MVREVAIGVHAALCSPILHVAQAIQRGYDQNIAVGGEVGEPVEVSLGEAREGRSQSAAILWRLQHAAMSAPHQELGCDQRRSRANTLITMYFPADQQLRIGRIGPHADDDRRALQTTLTIAENEW
eukprot:scaffold8859_cov169-Ochromonas_danica.AAC.8